MKKLYTILASVALVAASAAAATPANKAPKLGTDAGAAQQFSVAGKSIASNTIAKAMENATPVAKRAASKAPETGEWKSIGMGQWQEALLAMRYSDVEYGVWSVEIEQNGDWYRLIPYGAEGNPVAELMGYLDDSYFYINAADPNKVYADDFIPYGGALGVAFSNYVPEEEWVAEADGYGVLENKIFKWAPNTDDASTLSWLYYRSQSWYYAPQEEGVAVALPGGYLPNYTLSIEAPLFTATPEVVVNVKPGYSFKNLHYIILKGEYSIDYFAEAVAEYGEHLENMGAMTIEEVLPAEGNGVYQIIVVGTDEEGNIRAAAGTDMIYRNEDGADWQKVGTTEFTECIYSWDYELDPNTYTVDVEQDMNMPTRVRLVDPFLQDPLLSEYPADDADKYDCNLYFNVSNPEFLELEASVTGVNVGSGDGALWGFADYMLEGVSEEEYNEGYEFFMRNGYNATLVDNVVNFPPFSIMFAERYYADGIFMPGMYDMTFELPAGFQGVESAVVSGDAPTTYYNLQGVRVDNPAKGGIYIRTQGGKASKVAF